MGEEIQVCETERFVNAVIDQYGDETPATIAWDTLSKIGTIEVVDKMEDADEPQLDRYGHVLQRNGLKSQFNLYCRMNNKPYQLFIQESGVSVVLKKGEDALYSEEVRLIEHLAKRLSSIKAETMQLADFKGLKPSSRTACRALGDGVQGLCLVLHGLATRVSLPSKIHRKLLDSVTELLIPEESDQD